MPLTAIAAIDPNRVIGREGGLPWHLPEDLKLFKSLTLGHTIIMGRRTWDSLPRKPLPGRQHIVLSRTLVFPGITIVPTISQLGPELAGLADTAYLIGGAALYASLLPFCDELVLSHVHAFHCGDVWFPEYESMFEPIETLLETNAFHSVRYRNKAPVHLPGTEVAANVEV